MIEADLVVDYPNAKVVLSSLKPEVECEFSRTYVEMSGDDEMVLVSIKASDTTAMRAALNSYLGCIKVIESIDSITKGEK